MSSIPRTFVRLFKPQFARLIRLREKWQTIRPIPKRLPKPGDLIDCREWEGKPYRSKQRKLGSWPITRVQDIYISSTGIVFIDGIVLGLAEKVELASADGFSNGIEMIQWFSDTHGLPFKGILIIWSEETDAP